MRRQAPLWCIGLYAALLAGCATGPARRPGVIVREETRQPGGIVKETLQPGVRVVKDSPIEEPKEDKEEIAQAEVGPVDPAPGKFEEEDLPIGATPEEAADPQVAMKEALADAMAWTVEGLRQYRAGAVEAAHKSLNDAHSRFLEADLPEALVERGLNLFQGVLPEDVRLDDPEAIRLYLDRTDLPDKIELAERAVVEGRVRDVLSQLGDLPSEGRNLKDLIAETHRYVQYFRGRKRQFYESTYLRKHKYWPTIQSVFAKKELPAEFGYVAFVESGFQPRVASSKAAFGLWQFIEGTGKAFGLESFPADFYDAEKSTNAAASFLFQLDNLFGSRLLAMAAYNWGEGRVRNCLREIKSPGKRSFWGIRDCLPEETKAYVPQVLAAAVIGSDPKLFGFDLPDEEKMREIYDVIVVEKKTSVARLAELAETDVATLRKANTELGLTETPGDNFPLYVPKGRGVMVLAGLAVEERLPKIAPMGSLEVGLP